MEVIVITQLFNKYFTILINRVLLDEVVLLCLPNQLAELNPPGCQQKVDEDVLRTEGLASQHPFRQKMPGGESFPVPDFKNKRVVVLVSNPMAGCHIIIRDPYSSLFIDHSEDHVQLGLRSHGPSLLILDHPGGSLRPLASPTWTANN